MEKKIVASLIVIISGLLISYNVFALSNLNDSEKNALLDNKVLRNHLRSYPIKYPAHIDGGTYYAQGAAGQGELFVPLLQMNEGMFYTDFRYFDRAGPAKEGNLALGFRHTNAALTQLFGFYASIDRKKTDTSNFFNQFTIGGEWWHHDTFLGGNIYIPQGGQGQSVPANNYPYLQPIGINLSNIYFNNGLEVPMQGMDAQLGYRAIGGLYLYGGGYVYKHSHLPHVVGSRARANLILYSQPGKIYHYTLLDRVSLETNLQYDNVQKLQSYAGIRLSFNLDRKSLPSSQMTGVGVHMVDPIYRDLDIITSNMPQAPDIVQRSRGGAVIVETIPAGSAETLLDSALANPDVDVVAINGNLSVLNSTLNTPAKPLNRDIYITGVNYIFNYRGQTYTLPVTTTPGSITVTNSGTPNPNYGLLQIVGANQTTLRDITIAQPPGSGYITLFNVPDSTTPSGNLGSVVIDNVIETDGRFHFSLNGPSTGSVSVTNSRFDLGTTDFLVSTIDQAALVFLSQNGAILTVSNVSNNHFTGTGEGYFGIRNYAAANSTITYSNGLQANTFSFGNNLTTPVGGITGLFSEGVYNGASGAGALVEFMGPCMGNTFNITSSYLLGGGTYNGSNLSGTGTSGFNKAVRNVAFGAGAQIIFDQAFKNNVFNIQVQNVSATEPSILELDGISNGAQGGQITFRAPLTNNNITINATTGLNTYLLLYVNGIQNSPSNANGSTGRIDFNDITNNNITISGQVNASTTLSGVTTNPPQNQLLPNTILPKVTVIGINNYTPQGSIEIHGNFSNNTISALVDDTALNAPGTAIAVNDQLNAVYSGTSVTTVIGYPSYYGGPVYGASSIIYDQDWTNNTLYTGFTNNPGAHNSQLAMVPWQIDANGGNAIITYKGIVANNTFSKGANTYQDEVISLSASNTAVIGLNGGFVGNNVGNYSAAMGSRAILLTTFDGPPASGQNSITIGAFYNNVIYTPSGMTTIQFTNSSTNIIYIAVNPLAPTVTLSAANNIAVSTLGNSNSAGVVIVPGP